MRTFALCVAVLSSACASKKPILGESPEAQKFAPLAFLVGDWEGQAGGANGVATGSFSLNPDLQTHVLSRRGFNVNGPKVHEDLTVIYIQGNDLRADYWDNEGKVIRYQIYPEPQVKQVVFLSNPSAGDGAQYRTIYRSIDDDTIEMKFEIGHAGSDFQPSLSGQLKRRKK